MYPINLSFVSFFINPPLKKTLTSLQFFMQIKFLMKVYMDNNFQTTKNKMTILKRKECFSIF
jgi:hypothetical protein